MKLIAENTGVSGDVILSQSLENEGDMGYDAEIGDFTPLLERGIMDPAKVTRAAIENAASVAAMVLTTESLITDIKEPEPPMPAAPPMDYQAIVKISKLKGLHEFGGLFLLSLNCVIENGIF